MKTKILYLMFFSAGLLYANSNINISGSFVNNGTINNTQINNNDKDKALFDLRIKKSANEILKDPAKPYQSQKSIILDVATQINKYNLNTLEKKEKCIEHSLSIGFIKMGASFVRKECNKIFN